GSSNWAGLIDVLNRVRSICLVDVAELIRIGTDETAHPLLEQHKHPDRKLTESCRGRQLAAKDEREGPPSGQVLPSSLVKLRRLAGSSPFCWKFLSGEASPSAHHFGGAHVSAIIPYQPFL